MTECLGHFNLDSKENRQCLQLLIFQLTIWCSWAICQLIYNKINTIFYDTCWHLMCLSIVWLSGYSQMREFTNFRSNVAHVAHFTLTSKFIFVKYSNCAHIHIHFPHVFFCLVFYIRFYTFCDPHDIHIWMCLIQFWNSFTSMICDDMDGGFSFWCFDQFQLISQPLSKFVIWSV